jgi:hypothetical protein
MKKFLLGFVIGVFLTVCIYFAPYTDPRFRIEVGRMLDEDIIYLKSGTIVQGRIINETEEEIFIELKEGYFNLSLSQCEKIKRNHLFQYIRELL